MSDKQIDYTNEECLCFAMEWEYWTRYATAPKWLRKKLKRKPLPCETGYQCPTRKRCIFWMK